MPRLLSRRSVLAASAVAASLSLGLTACGSGSGSGSKDLSSSSVQFMVPSGAGGGWDTTARTMAEVLEKDKIMKKTVQVFNVEGGGGATGLAKLQGSKGDPAAWMVTGLVMLGALEQADSKVTLSDDTTPIATLTAEAEAARLAKAIAQSTPRGKKV